MQNDLTESVQASIRPGEMVDTYYYGETNVSKQAYPAVVTTRFVQQFTQLGAGSSQFVISPAMGISDIVCQFVTPANTGQYTGAALPQGWGYSLINRLSVRYGSSAQYFWTGPQMWNQIAYECESRQKAEDMLNLGGQFLATTAMGGAVAYVYIKLPHNSPRAQGKPLPFASDLLVQPIVLTIELNSLQSVAINQTGSGAVGTVPTALASAQMQVKQEMLTDSSDQLARRVDMNTNAYTFVCPHFAQQEVTVQVASTASSLNQSINLSGFRAGEVKSILLWLTPTANSTVGNGAYLPLTWQLMNNVQLTYNGEIFARFDSGSSQLWNAVENEKVCALNVISPNTGSAGSTTALSYYIEAPFAQVNMPYDRESKFLHGKPILNAVVNLTFDVPALSTSYILHAQYLYNASLLCSRGSAEYIF
jgi:hypothetical protein